MQLKSYDKVLDVLFEPTEKVEEQGILSRAQLDIKKRCLSIYMEKIDDPLIPDKDIAEKFSKLYDVSVRTIYNDIRAVETVIGNIKRASKDYVRFMVVENQKYAIQKERDMIESGQKKSTKDLSYATHVLGKYTNLDQQDPELPPWDELQPAEVEITDDVTVMDLEEIPEDEIEKLKRKYLQGYKEGAEDVEIIE